MWGTWLFSYAIVFSAMHQLPHTAYVAALAPPLAALSGAGIVLLWQWYTSGDRRGLVLPFAVAAELAWAMWLWSGHPGFLPWARWAMLGVGAAAIVALIPAQLPGPGWRRLRRVALAGAVAAMLIGPATWAASVLDEKYAGSSFDASAGPAASASSVCIFGPNGKAQPGLDQGCPAGGAVTRTGRAPDGPVTRTGRAPGRSGQAG